MSGVGGGLFVYIIKAAGDLRGLGRPLLRGGRLPFHPVSGPCTGLSDCRQIARLDVSSGGCVVGVPHVSRAVAFHNSLAICSSTCLHTITGPTVFLTCPVVAIRKTRSIRNSRKKLNTAYRTRGFPRMPGFPGARAPAILWTYDDDYDE